jgi:hypothetical protein
MEKISLVAEPSSIVERCKTAKKDIDDELVKRLYLLEQYDFGFLLLGLSPRRLLRDGRLFDNEQVLPLLLWFGQWDKHCRYWASEIVRQWMIFNPSENDFEGVSDDRAIEFRNYFYDKYAIPLVEEFRQFVALCMLFPEESNAPAGPIDMVWHSFLLNTDEYSSFSEKIWLGAPHLPPDVPEEQIR